MRRSVWIFLASIFLPSLGLAWLAIRSAQDQQVVLEHQQVLITQNITDALAQNVQARMDQVRDDFVFATRQLLGASAPPQVVAADFNRKIHGTWPMAAIGFAVNLDGEIFSPGPDDGPDARTFRTENDRFLSNRENAEIYSSNSSGLTQNFRNVPSFFALQKAQINQPDLRMDKATSGQAVSNVQDAMPRDKIADLPAAGGSSDDELHAASGLTAPSAKAAERTRESSQTNAPPTTARALPADSFFDESVSAAAMLHASSKSQALDKDVAEEKRAQDRDAAVGAAARFAAAAPASAPALPSPTSASLSSAGSGSVAAPAPSAPLAGSLNANSAGIPPDEPTTPAPVIMNEQALAKIPRQVIPQKMPVSDTAAISNTVPEESDFRRVIGSGASGSLARFLENKLRLMVWSHPADTPIVFGAQLDPTRLADTLKATFQIPALQPQGESRSGRADYCVAILDDTGRPVAVSVDGFKSDWKHPFVATEIGEALPHWEAALYLIDPQQIGRAARTLQATLGLIVLVLVTAIGLGGSLVAGDVRRQMRLAQQKTDFVSNVSHELKTPLTSIRMFADLLAEKRVPDEQRQATYLRIISAEAARLTRLINNVLDFARLERGAPPGEPRDGDLVEAVHDVIETCGPHLEAAGLAFQSEIEASTLPIRGDRDALAQIILNLVSNAEKYGGSDILVRARRQETPGGALGCVDVLDRGPGIPPAEVKTVFEPFHRLDDSLSSGIPGSGLGLTLARRMARSHGGDVTYAPRAGGGSCFTLTVPLRPK